MKSFPCLPAAIAASVMPRAPLTSALAAARSPAAWAFIAFSKEIEANAICPAGKALRKSGSTSENISFDLLKSLASL